MKKLFFFLALTISSLNGFCQPPVVYIDFVTHNEDVSSWTGASAYYTTNRAKLITLTNYLQTKSATWNMQSDYTYLTAVIAKETGTVLTTTNNKNILRWMYEDKGVEMDPHSHENVYIYPDVVKLMDSIGLPESKMVGGNLYAQANGINTWTALANPSGQNGVIFPSKNWKPTYMMGGGTPGHVADLAYYGMWNPQSMTSYLTHDTAQHLRHMGVGCTIKVQDTTTVMETVNAVRDLINKVQSGQYPASGFYFQSIFFEQGDLNTTLFYNKLITVIDSLSAIVGSGKAQWKTMKQAYTIWETSYSKKMFQWNCGQVLGIEEQNLINLGVKLYPNPNQGLFNLRIDSDIKNAEIILLNSLGQQVYSQTINKGDNIVAGTNLSKGLYYYVLKDNERQLTTGKIAME